MPTKIIPTFQRQTDTKDGVQFVITKVVVTSTTNPNFFVIGQTTDARILLDAGQALPLFYISEGGVMNIDAVAANVGQEFTFASRHNGRINFRPVQ